MKASVTASSPPDYYYQEQVQSLQTLPSSSSTLAIILNPLDHDVIMGRSKDCFNHEGNRRFRLIIAAYHKCYRQWCSTHLQTKGREMAGSITLVVNYILDDLRRQKFRFLKPCDDGSSGFLQVDANTARCKIRHALRDVNVSQWRALKKKVTSSEEHYKRRPPDGHTSNPAHDLQQHQSSHQIVFGQKQQQQQQEEKEVVVEDKGEEENASAVDNSYPTMLVSKKCQSSAACWSLQPTSNYHGNEDDFLGKIDTIPIQCYTSTFPNSICCGNDTGMLLLNHDNDIHADNDVYD
jgi:hypothetical protein